MAADTPIVREGDSPLHEQVAAYVREKIYAREWGQGAPLPSENELRDMLGVSRGTVKQGIQHLVDEGLVVAERGRGTFVTRPLMARPSTERLLSFAESMDEQEISYVTEVVTHEVVPATPSVAEALTIEEGAEHLHLMRVRRVRGRPVMFIESHLNLTACPGLAEADFTREGVFAAVERTSGRKVGEAEMTYAACVAGRERGSALECDEYAPVLTITQLVRLDDGTPFEFGGVWLPANRCVIKSTTRRA